MTKTQKTALKSKVKILLVGILVGIVVGVIGLRFLQIYNPKDAPETELIEASVVFERIQSQNELVCASQKYNITEKAERTSNIPFTNVANPLTTHSYWYRYVGTIKVSVDLETAEYALEDSTITITLDQPGISSNTPDMDESGVLEENHNILNPITIDEVDDFRRQCRQQSEEEALAGGILDEARSNAEHNIRAMFFAALDDDYAIRFVWREANNASGEE